MKQHIDKQQVLDLTDKQAVAIYNILYKANYTFDDLDGRGAAGGGFKDKKGWFNSAFEINMTIGKMIDILEKEFGHFEVYKEIEPETDKKIWWVECNKESYYEYELCDVLLEAIKEIL